MEFVNDIEPWLALFEKNFINLSSSHESYSFSSSHQSRYHAVTIPGAPITTNYRLRALEGTYIDKKCPFTGNVSIRGRILTGVVQKMKMQRTIVIRRDYLHYIRKYNRFEKRHRNMSVHLSPCFRDVEIGDVVTIGECRPLSKTVRFNVLKVSKGTGSKKSFKKF
ncbi:40S ribosomal protein S11 [Trachymyrmex cornetzi]|uniref:Small ribosomal subunit protein uS17 n=1 Tax=Trachymyrmex cornetzi TaxID=471704 RepID=A0A151IUT4_9HYME|nr:40S ribosomal protein S11 [Trachymyrmex cornetzi]